jgi:hypothetical protein
MRVSMRGLLLVAVIWPALALTSCLGEDGSTENSPAGAAGPDRDSAIRQDPELVGAGSPGRVVQQYWRYLRSGIVPTAIALYDDEVRRRVGVATFAGAMSEQEYVLRGTSEPVVVRREDTEAGALVTTVTRQRDRSNLRTSFILRRDQGGRWRIVYDTVMSRALPGFETTRVQNETAPGAGSPGPDAFAAGASVAERYGTALFTDDGRLRPEEGATRTGAGAPP